MLLIIIGLPTMVLICAIIFIVQSQLKKGKCVCCKTGLTKLIKTAKDKLMFSMPIRTIIIAYLQLSIMAKPSSWAIPEQFPWRDLSNSENLTHFFGTIFVLGILITHFTFACRVTYESLIDPQFDLKWGGLFVGLKKTRGWKPIAVYSVFFARRLLFTFILDEILLVVQFVSIGFLSLWVMAYYLGVKPYIEYTDFMLEAGNECAFLFMTYFILMFSDFVPDHETRSLIGWGFNGLIGLQIFVNFTWLFVTLIKAQINKCKLKKLQKQYREE